MIIKLECPHCKHQIIHEYTGGHIFTTEAEIKIENGVKHIYLHQPSFIEKVRKCPRSYCATYSDDFIIRDLNSSGLFADEFLVLKN